MLAGRIRGAMADDGETYELRQGEKLLQSIPIDEARGDKKLAAAIKRNAWGALS
jgi:hypothetical protein